MDSSRRIIEAPRSPRGAEEATMAQHRSSAVSVGAAGLLFVVLLVGSPSALAGSNSPRIGELRVTKECSQYSGQAGAFCTITSSNIPWIKAGMRVVYADAPDFATLTLDSDVVLSRGDGSAANGHVNLNIFTGLGTLTFDGGRGAFKTFHGSVAVTVTDRGTPDELWHWSGTYSFGSSD
jgi:hypothetical protein